MWLGSYHAVRWVSLHRLVTLTVARRLLNSNAADGFSVLSGSTNAVQQEADDIRLCEVFVIVEFMIDLIKVGG